MNGSTIEKDPTLPDFYPSSARYDYMTSPIAVQYHYHSEIIQMSESYLFILLNNR